MSIRKQLVLLAMLGIAATTALIMDGPSKREIKKGRFGALEIIEWLDTGMQKEITLPHLDYLRDYVQQADFLKEATEQIKVNK